METKLRCTLSPGQFSSELVAVIQASSGREYSLFAQKADLDYQDAPTEGVSVSGWIKVEVVDIEGRLCLVRLPQSTLENGQFVTVLTSQLDKAPEHFRVSQQ